MAQISFDRGPQLVSGEEDIAAWTEQLPDHVRIEDEGGKPIFIGQYWLTGIPEPQSDRVACVDYSVARKGMVSKDGGVPLVLDDALGSTDEGRFESMGAVLRIASQDIQTIILTCAPERYVHVGAQVSAAM
jgi:hypothetical protein